MPQNKTTRLSELRVGILVLMALAILILVIFAVSGDLKIPGFGKTTTVRTEMSSVDGLRKGAEVRLSGKKIGSVREMNFSRAIPADPQAAISSGNIEIVMDIDGTLDGRPAIERIRSDSVATLKTAGVLGDNVIDISPGTLSGKAIVNGDRIKSEAQKSVGDIMNLANNLGTNLNIISEDIKGMTKDLRAGKGTAGRFLNDDQFYVNLNETILKAQNLISAIREGEGTLSKLINDPQLYGQVTDTINQLRGISTQLNDQLTKGDGTVGKLVKSNELYDKFNSLVTKVDQISVKLDTAMDKVNKGEGNLGKLLNDEKLYNQARETVEKLNAIATRLEKGEGTAGMLLKDDKLYNNVNTLSAEMTKLIYDFRQNPKKYLSVKVTIF